MQQLASQPGVSENKIQANLVVLSGASCCVYVWGGQGRYLVDNDLLRSDRCRDDVIYEGLRLQGIEQCSCRDVAEQYGGNTHQ